MRKGSCYSGSCSKVDEDDFNDAARDDSAYNCSNNFGIIDKKSR